MMVKILKCLVSCFLTTFMNISLLILMPFDVNAQANSQEKLIDMVILMDRSSSMIKNDPQGLTIPAASYVLEQISMMNEANRAAIIPFADTVYILGQEKQDIGKALSMNIPGLIEMLMASVSDGDFSFTLFDRSNKPDLQLLREQMKVYTYTEMDMALNLAAKILANSKTNRRKMILLISDGQPWPDANNSQRTRELKAILGNGYTPNSEGQKLYEKHILRKTVPFLSSQNISVYPVAVVDKVGHETNLITYLKMIKEMTTGDRDQIIVEATSSNLIDKLTSYIPAGDSYLQLESFKGSNKLVQAGAFKKKISKRITIPSVATQVRFFLSYPDATSQHKPEVSLFKIEENVEKANSSRIDWGNILFTRQNSMAGAIVYQSFKVFEKPCDGEWELRLTDGSSGQKKGLPNVDLMVDIRANLELSLDLNVAMDKIKAESPFKIDFNLNSFHNDNVNHIKIDKIRAYVIGRSPLEISSFNKRIYEENISDNPSLSTEITLTEPGSYSIRGNAFFTLNNFSREHTLYFEKDIIVKAAEPVDAWFSFKEIKSKISEPVNISTIGEILRIDYKNLFVRTDSNSIIKHLGIERTEPYNDEIDIELTGNWITILPRSIKRVHQLSASNPTPLEIKIDFPDIVLDEIKDGNYRTTLSLQQGIDELHTIQLEFGIKVPRFIQHIDEAMIMYHSPDDYPPIIEEKTIYYPGISPHKYEIPFYSSSIESVTAEIIIENSDGLTLIQENSRTRTRNKNVVYSVPDEHKRVEIFGKNESSPGKVHVNVVLNDPSLNKHQFMNKIRVQGDKHRPREVHVVTKIEFIPKFIMYIISFFILGISALFFKSARSWYKTKCLMAGYRYEGSDKKVSLNLFGSEIARFDLSTDDSDDDDSSVLREPAKYLEFTKRTINSVKRYERLPAEPDDALWDIIDDTIKIGQNDNIKICLKRKKIEIIVDKIPEDDDNIYSFYVESSPFTNFHQIKMNLFFFLSAFFMALFTYLLFDPYALLRIFV
ncbi:MAG: VWA domain-containing protein [Desulfamplus sp.]|nr:VWA domain-containing protein [Desulfamplus sp.]